MRFLNAANITHEKGYILTDTGILMRACLQDCPSLSTCLDVYSNR